MGSRFRCVSRPAISLLKTTISKRASSPNPSPFLFTTRSSVTARRWVVAELGCVQSLLPLHSAVSSARLTSCLGIDSRSSRSLSQEMGLSTPR